MSIFEVDLLSKYDIVIISKYDKECEKDECSNHQPRNESASRIFTNIYPGLDSCFTRQRHHIAGQRLATYGQYTFATAAQFTYADCQELGLEDCRWRAWRGEDGKEIRVELKAGEDTTVARVELSEEALRHCSFIRLNIVA